MFNSINEIKDFINNNGNREGILENFIDEHYEKFKNIGFKYKEIIEREMHRWYELGTVVYEVYKDNILLGYLGIDEVIEIKSEGMTYCDLYVNIVAHNVKEIVKKSFEIVRESED